MGIQRKIKNAEGFISIVVLVIMTGILLAALTISDLSVRLSRTATENRALLQARLAADTGIERAKVFLMADPLWSDGSVAVGPVDKTSEVEEVIIDHIVQEGKQVAVVTSTGKCANTRKTVRAVIETGLVPLVSAYGGGIKQLKENSSITVGGNSWIRSDVLVNGSLAIQGNGWIGSPSKKRTVYVNGLVDMGQKGTLFGDVYSTSYIYGKQILGDSYPYWKPPTAFPDIRDVGALVSLARSVAQTIEKVTGEKHYFQGNKTFTTLELSELEGTYFVEGNVYLPGGSTNARGSIVASGNIYVNGSLQAEGLVLMTASDLILKNASNTSIALAVAGGDAGWKQTGGGNASFTLKYGALVAGTINGGDLRGSVVLEQNDAVDFGTLSAPVHTTKIVARSEL